jgi:CPA2 family monovalent cation:H+ antiporter-2
LIPKNEIACLVAQLRDDGYQMLRNISSAATLSVADLTPHLHDIEIAPLVVPQNSWLAGKSLAEIDLRRKTGLTLLAIRRNAQMITNLDAHTKIQQNDELFVIGPPDKVVNAALYLFG